MRDLQLAETVLKAMEMRNKKPALKLPVYSGMKVTS